MEEVVVSEAEVMMVTTRTFAGLIANVEHQKLIVKYREEVKVGSAVISSVLKDYPRDYAYWEASELGQIIAAMVNNDLAQSDPATPREEPVIE